MGFDVDQAKVDQLLAGRSYIKHIPAEWIARYVADGRFVPTADMRRLGEPDALLICVPTPLNETRDPDLTYIEQTAEQIAAALRPGQLVVLESTTYPGTTREVVLPILQKRGGPASGPRFLPGLQSRAGGSGQSELHRRADSQGRGRNRCRQRPAGRTALWPGHGPGRAGLELRNRRGRQDPGKHLPLGQHRPGQRVEDALHADRHRRLGGDRRRPHQALRIPGLLSRPRFGRALHSHRPVLSHLAGPAERHDDPLHRTGRRDQHRHAGVRDPPAGRGPERFQQAAAGQP